MADDSYTLGDLARLADTTPRTVRYYVAQGLLPSPDAAGPNTRYGEGHLARLRLIKRLQRDHLPLAEIRLRLERMGDEEVAALATALETRDASPVQPEPRDALGFVHTLMRESGIRPGPPPRSMHASLARRIEPRVAEERVPLAAMAAPAAMPAPSAPQPAPSAARSVADRSTWERLVLAPDVELHVRRPLDRTTNKRVDQLERYARELFDEP